MFMARKLTKNNYKDAANKISAKHSSM